MRKLYSDLSRIRLLADEACNHLCAVFGLAYLRIRPGLRRVSLFFNKRVASAVSAHTILPVIGVPIPSTSLNGMDSLLSTVQMPAGIPVATVAIGKPGATNAGILAAQMIGLSDESLSDSVAAKTATRAKPVLTLRSHPKSWRYWRSRG